MRGFVRAELSSEEKLLAQRTAVRETLASLLLSSGGDAGSLGALVGLLSEEEASKVRDTQRIRGAQAQR
jgi:hypothetical protein